MWFRRKPKNRRLGREQVLDVKLRSSQVRAARTRLGAICLGVLFATVFGLYLVYRTGDWALNRCVYENKAFTIQELDVQTDGVIAVDQLRRWAGVASDENLLALDLARVKRDLEMDFPAPCVSALRSASRSRKSTSPCRVGAEGLNWPCIIWTRRAMSCCRWTRASEPRGPTRGLIRSP